MGAAAAYIYCMSSSPRGCVETEEHDHAIESHLVETAMLSRVIVGWIVEVISPGSCQ